MSGFNGLWIWMRWVSIRAPSLVCSMTLGNSPPLSQPEFSHLRNDGSNITLLHWAPGWSQQWETQGMGHRSNHIRMCPVVENGIFCHYSGNRWLPAISVHCNSSICVNRPTQTYFLILYLHCLMLRGWRKRRKTRGKAGGRGGERSGEQLWWQWRSKKRAGRTRRNKRSISGS